MAYDGQYNRKTDKVFTMGQWMDPMPGFNVEDDWKRPRMKRKKKYTRKKRTTPKSKRLSLTVKKRGVVWRMVKKFKSKASRLRAKRGLAKKGWR